MGEERRRIRRNNFGPHLPIEVRFLMLSFFFGKYVFEHQETLALLWALLLPRQFFEEKRLPHRYKS